jgi:hypothetical protein
MTVSSPNVRRVRLRIPASSAAPGARVFIVSRVGGITVRSEKMLSAGQRRKEFARLDAALRPARVLVCDAVDAMVAHARRAPGDSPPSPPASVIAQLHEAISITAACGLPRSSCAKFIEDEFLIRMCLRAEDLDLDAVTSLMAHTRASLDTALLQQ